MPDAAVPALVAWQSFYVIIGSSSAALTGLMFVVVTLLPEARLAASAPDDAISAFSTPTVVHFCAALLVSATLTAPWTALSPAGWVVASTGVAGLGYACMVVVRVHRQKDYQPVVEDWIWHTILPFVAYGAVIAGGLLLSQQRPTGALFSVATATLLMLFVGIHNAWDTVTYLALQRLKSTREAKQESNHDSGSASRPSRHARKS